MYGCGVDGREVGEVRLVRPLPDAKSGSEFEARPGSLHVVFHRLHPMDAAVAEDPELGRQARALILSEGESASTLPGTRE